MTGRRGLLLAALLLLAACAGRPPVEQVATTAFVDTGDTRLAALADSAPDPALSGVRLLADPLDAFTTLIRLAEAAERSLDLQYYAWHDDTTGRLLLRAVWQAAGRGVRVRLLLDDLHSSRLDEVLATFDAHPMIEVRLFNPFRHRAFRALDFIRDFTRSNQRMHNKSFIADNAAAVLGGRNVGDAYFVPGPEAFIDLDVLVAGAVVADVSRQFDLYWNHPLAAPAASLLRSSPLAMADLEALLEVHAAGPASLAFLHAVSAATGTEPLDGGALEWAPVRLVHDLPEKIAAERFEPGHSMIPELRVAFGVPERRLDIVTAYFVIGPLWTDLLGDWVARGVDLRILTNSLATIDIGIAHAGYAGLRPALLDRDVELWEMMPAATAPAGPPAVVTDGPTPLWTSWGGTQHAKAAAIDGRRLFVGSFNLDLRSAYLNTEMGIVIDSPVLAAAVHRLFDEEVEAHAFEVRRDRAGGLVWVEHAAAGERHHTTEPGGDSGRAFIAAIGRLLPIDWLL